MQLPSARPPTEQERESIQKFGKKSILFSSGNCFEGGQKFNSGNRFGIDFLISFSDGKNRFLNSASQNSKKEKIMSKRSESGMAGKPPLLVSCLADALNLKTEYPEAACWVIAPLATRAGSGRRSWHVIKLDADGSYDGWIKESEVDSDAQTEFVLPTPDMSAEDVPPLPDSKLKLWELCYCDDNADRLAPRIWIDHNMGAAEGKPRRQEAASGTIPTSGAGVAVPPPTAPIGGAEAALLRALQIQSASNEKLMAHIQGLVGTVSLSIEKIGVGHAQLGQLFSAELQRTSGALKSAEQARDVALGANTALLTQLAEARATSQGWIAFTKIYEKKPELLHDGIRDLVTGIFASLRNAANSSV